MRLTNFRVFAAATALSLGSAFVAFWGAREPFNCLYAGDAMILVGGSLALFLAWVALEIGVVRSMVREELRWAWTPIVPWAGICTSYMVLQVYMYCWDLEKYIGRYPCEDVWFTN